MEVEVHWVSAFLSLPLTSGDKNSSLIEVWITADLKMWIHQLKVVEAALACKHWCKRAFSRAWPAQQCLYWVFVERRSSKAALINAVQCVFPTPAQMKDCSGGCRDNFKNLHAHTNKHKHGLVAQMDLYVWMHREAHRGWKYWRLTANLLELITFPKVSQLIMGQAQLLCLTTAECTVAFCWQGVQCMKTV